MSRYWIISDDAGLQTLHHYYEMFLSVQSAISVKYATQNKRTMKGKMWQFLQISHWRRRGGVAAEGQT